MDRGTQTLEWLRQYADNKGKQSTFLRCKPYIQFAAEKLSGYETMHRRNVVSESLDWIQSFEPVHENDIKYFKKLPVEFSMKNGIRTQPQGVFELLASKAFIELVRGMIRNGDNITLCCYELRPYVSSSKIMHLSEKQRDDVIHSNPNIVAMAKDRGIGYLAALEEHFIDLRLFICGLNLVRSMVVEMREDMQRCGLLRKDGIYAPITADSLPKQSHKIQTGPFKTLKNAEKRRMVSYIDSMSDSKPVQTPEDATKFEKTLAAFTQDFFPLFGRGTNIQNLCPFRQAYKHRGHVLYLLGKEASSIPSAPIALCQWGAFEALACVMRHRTMLPNFLHLSRWKEFLAYCIEHRYWAIVLTHRPYFKVVCNWNMVWPVQLHARLETLELEKFDCRGLRWRCRKDPNALLFELLQTEFLEETKKALSKNSFDSKWSDPKTGKTLLHAVCEKGDITILRMFVDKVKPLHFHWRGHDGLTPLHAAATLGNETVVCYLLQQQRVEKCSVAVCCSGELCSPLYTAINNGLSLGTVKQIASFYSRNSLKDIREKLPRETLLKYRPSLCKKQKRQAANIKKKAKRLKLS